MSFLTQKLIWRKMKPLLPDGQIPWPRYSARIALKPIIFPTILSLASPAIQTPFQTKTATSIVPQAIEVGEGSALPWCLDDKYPSQIIFDVRTSHRLLLGPRGCQGFEYLRPTIYADIGREEIGRGTTKC